MVLSSPPGVGGLFSCLQCIFGGSYICCIFFFYVFLEGGFLLAFLLCNLSLETPVEHFTLHGGGFSLLMVVVLYKVASDTKLTDLESLLLEKIIG